MTPSTIKRLGHCYKNMVGYDPFEDDPTIEPQHVLGILRDMRTADTLNPDDPASYVGPTLTSATLRNGIAHVVYTLDGMEPCTVYIIDEKRAYVRSFDGIGAFVSTGTARTRIGTGEPIYFC